MTTQGFGGGSGTIFVCLKAKIMAWWTRVLAIGGVGLTSPFDMALGMRCQEKC